MHTHTHKDTYSRTHPQTHVHAQRHTQTLANMLRRCQQPDRHTHAHRHGWALSSGVSSSQVLSCPTPASCPALASSWDSGSPTIPSSAPWPQPRPQAPGWQLPHSPRCQLNQTSHPKMEPGQRGVLQPARGISVGVAGGSQVPAVAEKGKAPAMQVCLARLPVSSSPSHPPSAGFRLLTSEMGQYTCPSDTSVKWTHHPPDDQEILPNFLLFHLYNNPKT